MGIPMGLLCFFQWFGQGAWQAVGSIAKLFSTYASLMHRFVGENIDFFQFLRWKSNEWWSPYYFELSFLFWTDELLLICLKGSNCSSLVSRTGETIPAAHSFVWERERERVHCEQRNMIRI